MRRISQPWRDDYESYSTMDIRLEIHVEQVQAIVQNLVLKEEQVCIAAVFVGKRGYQLGRFPLYTKEANFCRAVWEFGIKNDVDDLFITYPSQVFMIDNCVLEPMDFYTQKALKSDIKKDCAVLVHHTYSNSKYMTNRIWATHRDAGLTNWIEYDPTTLRKLKHGYRN
jgi:hypothetical protein